MSLKTLLEYHSSQKPIKVKDNENIIVMSFNIRCINTNDTGIKDYKVRMPYIRKVLEDENPDVIGFQEVKVPQFKYLVKILKNYEYEYQKRDDRKEGEANPVFFKKNRFFCDAKKTFWLSDNYEVMSNTFGGKCYRICSYVHLKDQKTDKGFYVFNTHLDHVGQIARVKGVQTIKKVIKELNVGNDHHLIIGDMNDYYGSKPITELFLNYKDASKFNHKENETTFHNYGTENKKIDYIALSKNITQLDYKTITTKFGDIFPSDHYPIEAVIKI